ncbi:MAG: diguanylate cyclase [Azovibrio sp.]|nr:diguanylate cyclase [Azovibrio sp.]
MTTQPLRLLLIEDNPGDARLIRETLRDAPLSVELEHADSLKSGFALLDEWRFDAVLLDLSLPDSHGLGTVSRTRQQAPELPIVVLTGLNDEATALQAMREGAQDYLIKGHVDSALLLRAIRYAIERNRMQSALHALSLLDDLTGIYNRRGFMTLAEHQMKLARRRLVGFYLIFIDLDGMKLINDQYGHPAGDRALIATAQLLSDTFRGSDVVARMGGDEFAVVTTEANGHGPPGNGRMPLQCPASCRPAPVHQLWRRVFRPGAGNSPGEPAGRSRPDHVRKQARQSRLPLSPVSSPPSPLPPETVENPPWPEPACLP